MSSFRFCLFYYGRAMISVPRRKSKRSILFILYSFYICFVKLKFKAVGGFASSCNSLKCNEFQGVDFICFAMCFKDAGVLKRS